MKILPMNLRLLLLIFAAGWTACGNRPEADADRPKEPLQRRVVEQRIAVANRMLPEVLDPFTVQDSIALSHDTLLVYHTLTLPEGIEEVMPPDSLKGIMAENLLESVRTDPKLSNLREWNYSFVFFYLDPEGTLFLRQPVTPAMYK